MTTAEEHDQLVTTLCGKVSRMANLIADRCEILLDEANGVLREEQKASVRSIEKATEKILVLVEAVEVDMSETDALTVEEFKFRMACFVNDLKGNLTTILGFAQISWEENLGRSLAATSYELLELPSMTKD